MKKLKIALMSTFFAVSPLVFATGSSSSGGGGGSSSSAATGVPELDAGVMGVAIALVLVVTTLVRARRKH